MFTPTHRYVSCPDRNQRDRVIDRMDEEQHLVTCLSCLRIYAAITQVKQDSVVVTTWPEDGSLSLSDCSEWETDTLGRCSGRVALNRHSDGRLVALCEYHFNQ